MISRVWWVALACAASSWAAQPDYFPLQVGNRWVLQTSTNAPELRTIEVARSRTINGETWFLVSGYAPDDRWLRKTADETVLSLNETTGAEEIVARLVIGAAAYRTGLSGCEQTTQPAAGPLPYGGPNFDVPAALSIAYAPDGCRDIGITQEIYAPEIGPMRRSITTIAGEITFNLVYARVNGSAVTGKSKEIVLADDFNHGSNGWLAGFSDYSLKTGDLRMMAELRPLPEEIGSQRSGFYVQSMNRSDDLFMFLKKPVASEDGLKANQAYRVSFDIRFASNAPSGCFGVGGSPGESVYLKAGASLDEPVALLDAAGDIRVSIGKGQQAAGGKEAGVIGNIANGTACDGPARPYVNVRREYAHPATVHTDERGSLWLIAGTDSGFEGLTGLYVESITVRINPAALPSARPSADRRRR